MGAPPKDVELRSQKSARMQHLASLLLNNSLQVKTSYQIAAECTNHRPYFQNFQGCSRPTSRHHWSSQNMYWIYSSSKYRFKYCQNARVYQRPWFQHVLCSCDSFQMPSGCTIYLHFFCSFKCRKNAPSIVLVFTLFSAVPNRFQFKFYVLITKSIFQMIRLNFMRKSCISILNSNKQQEERVAWQDMKYCRQISLYMW